MGIKNNFKLYKKYNDTDIIQYINISRMNFAGHNSKLSTNNS